MAIFVAVLALFVVCLAVSDIISERDVVRNRLNKAESAIQDLQRAEECRKLTRKKRGV